MRRTSTPKVKQWLAARPRFHLHFTPTYASWLNQVERWFGLLSQRAIKRGSFRSVPDLVSKIQTFIDRYNASATPFVWVATAQSIIDKVARIAMRIAGDSGALLRPLPVQAGQLGAGRRLDAGRRRQASQERLVARAGVPTNDAPQRRVRLQRRRVDAAPPSSRSRLTAVP